jgi:hypothetical protein
MIGAIIRALFRSEEEEFDRDWEKKARLEKLKYESERNDECFKALHDLHTFLETKHCGEGWIACSKDEYEAYLVAHRTAAYYAHAARYPIPKRLRRIDL